MTQFGDPIIQQVDPSGERFGQGLVVGSGEGVQEVGSVRDVLLDLDEPTIGEGGCLAIGFRQSESENCAFGEVETPGGVGDAFIWEDWETGRC